MKGLKKLEKIDKYLKFIIKIVTVIVALLSFIWAIFTFYNGLLYNFKLIEKNILRVEKEIKGVLSTLEQRSLKSVIYNTNIPLTERIEACDKYVVEGYNSLTKDYCEKLLKGEVK